MKFSHPEHSTFCYTWKPLVMHVISTPSMFQRDTDFVLEALIWTFNKVRVIATVFNNKDTSFIYLGKKWTKELVLWVGFGGKLHWGTKVHLVFCFY